MLVERGTNERLVLLLHCFEFSKQPRIWMNASQSGLVSLVDHEYQAYSYHRNR